MSEHRVFLEDQQGNIKSTGILLNPDKEELKRIKKKKELTPKEKKIISDKLYKSGDMKVVFEHGLGGHINMYYVKNEVLFNKLNLDTANISRLIYLATYIDWNTGNENMLVRPGQYNKVYPMKRKDLQLTLGLSDKAFINFLKDIKNNDLLFEANGKFYISSDYFNKGKVAFKKKEYTRLYISTVRDLFEQTAPRQHKQLSYLFKLIPKIHHVNNAIVEDPSSETPVYLSLVDICRFLGVNSDNKNASRTKRDLLSFHTTYDNVKRYAFKYITVESKGEKISYFVLNPIIAYSGDDFEAASETLKLCFFSDEKLTPSN